MRAVGSSLCWAGVWLAGCRVGGDRPGGLAVDLDASADYDAGPLQIPTRADVPSPPRLPMRVGALSGLVGPTRTPEVLPPAISGGTLLVARDGHTAVAADPDRDRVCFADLDRRAALGCVDLTPGDEPGRLAEDDGGRVHVALRRGGAVVTVDLATRSIVARRAVCAAPRGLAFDGATGLLHVACAGGELVSLRADGGAPTRTLRLDRDLRDVVVRGAGLIVSRFRDAELLTVASDGTVTRRVRPADARESTGRDRQTLGGRSRVAWRTLAHGDGVLVLHQRALESPVPVGPGGYGGGSRCQTGVVQNTLSVVGAGSPTALPTLSGVVLAVDAARSADGTHVALAVPGNGGFASASQVVVVDLGQLGQTPPGECATGAPAAVHGQVVAVAYAPDDRLVVQTREPATLQLPSAGATIAFEGESREDTGHRLFHSGAGAFVACASCHPEGGDDGHVWNFTPLGPRRTQNLHGGLAGTAPFHWDGDMATFAQLASEVFAQRMSGGALLPDQVAALERWATSQPAVPTSAPADTAAVERGRAVFDDPTVGCATCHGGPLFTNSVTVNVGTGAAFQVPSLRGVAARTPLLHNGCAATLRDRFGGCGGGDSHGHTSQLTAAQIDDLVAYLDTL